MGQISSPQEGVDIYLTEIENPYYIKEKPERAWWKDILGFPYEFIIVGIVIVILMIWIFQKKRARWRTTPKGHTMTGSGPWPSPSTPHSRRKPQP